MQIRQQLSFGAMGLTFVPLVVMALLLWRGAADESSRTLAGQTETFAVAYGTEASFFQAGACPSVICGPGDIAQAHKPNEFVAVSELEKCLGFLDRLGDWAAA